MVMSRQIQIVNARAHHAFKLRALGFKGIVIELSGNFKKLVKNDSDQAERKREGKAVPGLKPDGTTEMHMYSEDWSPGHLGQLYQPGMKTVAWAAGSIGGYSHVKATAHYAHQLSQSLGPSSGT